MSDMTESPIFALDIGTRSVVGLLMKRSNHCYEIIDMVIKEHNERSMLDGQIHNVLAVSELIMTIKQQLEEKHGPLKKVCVAAAGRSLKTKKGKFEIDLREKKLVNQDDIHLLELSAVQNAQFALAEEFQTENSFHYYCVGYSVVNYYLDGEVIGHLVDQTGTTASVEVIATFLPKVVVESLLAALTRADLELEALTLEPIAAINVLIPPSMRRLNVALVDIGAGTSDIAITEAGTVTAYGMVPTAGDEVTEAISDHYLLDFPDAEEVKRQLAYREEIVLTDILGFETTYPRDEVLKTIEPVIEHLATSITNEILELNHKPPKAVMLIGGGSLTPNLAKYVAKSLHLPENRVAIRGGDAIKQLTNGDQFEMSPELVTPIGIAIASRENPIDYLNVFVNGKSYRLFDIKQLTVGDALLASGIEISKLYGKPGMAMMIQVNGEWISIPGEHGNPPLLLKNGEQTTTDALIQENDEIVVQKGEDGKEAFATVKDIIDEVPAMNVTINGEKTIVQAVIHKNGKITNIHEPLTERDKIDIHMPKTIKEVLATLERFEEIELAKPIDVYVNGEKISLEANESMFFLNDHEATLQTEINDGDKLMIQSNIVPKRTVQNLLDVLKIKAMTSISVFFNDEPLTIEKPVTIVQRNGENLKLDDTIKHNDELTTISYGNSPFIFQDLFRKVKIDLTPQPNKKLVVRKNGKNAAFSETIMSGDKLEVRFLPMEEMEELVNPEV